MTTPSLAGQRRTWHSGHRKYQEVFTAPSHQPGQPTRGPRWLSGQLWARAHWLWSSEHSSHGSYRACLLWVCAPGPPASLLRALPPATCLHSLAHDPLLGMPSYRLLACSLLPGTHQVTAQNPACSHCPLCTLGLRSRPGGRNSDCWLCPGCPAAEIQAEGPPPVTLGLDGRVSAAQDAPSMAYLFF